MINYYLLFGFVIVLCILDHNIIHWIYLQFKRFELAVEKFFFRIKLEYDIFIIKYNKRKYLKMAKEILADLQKDEQV